MEPSAKQDAERGTGTADAVAHKEARAMLRVKKRSEVKEATMSELSSVKYDHQVLQCESGKLFITPLTVRT
jgi:hypothetical protein